MEDAKFSVETDAGTVYDGQEMSAMWLQHGSSHRHLHNVTVHAFREGEDVRWEAWSDEGVIGFLPQHVINPDKS